jgi:hypothetical protein
MWNGPSLAVQRCRRPTQSRTLSTPLVFTRRPLLTTPPPQAQWASRPLTFCHRLSRDRNLNLHPRLNVDDNLLHHLRRRIQINQPLVNPHLKHIPCLAPFTARCLACSDLQSLGRQANGTFDAEVLGLGALEELGADFFQRVDFAAGEGYADFVDFLQEEELVGREGWGVKVGGRRTGPSPRSFSGFWNDILGSGGLRLMVFSWLQRLREGRIERRYRSRPELAVR